MISFYWTDICFLTVLVIALLVILSALRKADSRQTLGRVYQQPLAVASSLVLGLFLCIGILDSIHINSETNNNQVTILDKLMSPLGSFYEKTYSAPLALQSYVMETVTKNSQSEQIYLPLKYPAALVKSSIARNQFIADSLLKALALSLGMMLIFLVLFLLITRSITALCSASGLTLIITLFLILFLICSSYLISRELHLLGTGKIGQDIFYYAIKSIRTGLVIGILTTLFMLPLALFLGIVAGYFGGLADDMIQYVYTTLSSIPGVLLITASVLSMQTWISSHPAQFSTLAKSADARLFALCLILGVTSWTSLCRLLRAEALKLREIDFVLAARALGSSSFAIIRKHLIPNMMPIILITLVLDFSFLVLAEAVLSYVGVGVSPMTISWGNMINSARLELARDPIVWWPMLAAFGFMFVLVLGANLFADALRDAFDPHQSGRG